jgi:hypothetical protein
VTVTFGAVLLIAPGCDCGSKTDLRTIRGGTSKGACARAEKSLQKCFNKPGKERHIACAQQLERRIEECN